MTWPRHCGISRRALLIAAWPAVRLLKAAQADDARFATDVNVVNLFATVRDKQANIVRDLKKDDFKLEEDGRPQTIRYFSRESDLPLTLGLLVDTSMSQRNVLGRERTASYHFLDRVLRENIDQAFVIHFDRDVELLQDLTSSRTKLESALAQMELPERAGGGPGQGGRPYPGSPRRRGGGGTSLYDAVLLASDELMKKQTGRKALILLTDGVDNGSKVSLTTAIESAQRADTLVYSILFADDRFYGGGFNGPRMGGMGRRGGYPGRYPQQNRPDGKKVLDRLSEQTGAGFFEVSHKLPIDKIFDQIQDELRNQYSLGYTSDRQDAGPGYRRINLTANRPGLVVRTREGYYAIH